MSQKIKLNPDTDTHTNKRIIFINTGFFILSNLRKLKHTATFIQVRESHSFLLFFHYTISPKIKPNTETQHSFKEENHIHRHEFL